MSHRCQSILFHKNGRTRAEMASVSADLPHGHAIPEHSHPEDQLLFASQGVMTLSTKQGIWVAPPMRAVSMSGRVSMRTLYFVPRLCRAVAKDCAVINVSPLLKELILHACRFPILTKKVTTQKRVIEIILDQLKSVDCIPLQLPQPSDLRAIRVARSLLVNPADPRTLDRMCRDSGASKRTVQRLFLQDTKMTFARWRQQLRLLHAMQLVGSGESVTMAALESGYNSTSAFVSMFRKQFGATPARYWKWEPNRNGRVN
jgi:AraC-like DNA-binding protein